MVTSPIDSGFPVLSEDASRMIKRRCFPQVAPSEDDLPKYSQRQFEYMEQAKHADLNRLRTECEQILLRKEKDMQEMRVEFDRLREMCMGQAKEFEKIQAENKILRRAVTIQNQQKEEATQENVALKQLAHQAADHIKRLEQTNYALRVHLHTSSAGGAAASSHFSSDVY
ncbi:hypothetical protein DYB37_004009 [Aphanomyces astaci]|nr:hypothetical protein DYB36_005625 [Aphanomyces astaci]RHY46079.1 hypothetical protein DYB38_007035 [Aphanomyces astaci]RHY70401.1 hypothetical protein DYB30_007017 [Aphanomyces astaci]RHY82444.1 hypothetical protein DYB35_004787 [Aphanomyces astaci]RHZ19314.1 hypothetical protein DYB37_004009 [Aphanomyces astaci]